MTTATSGSVVLSRATSGASGLSSFTPIYSGATLSDTGEATFFLDIGDNTPGPLQGGVQYVYQLTDVNGTVQSPPVIPASTINIERTNYSQIVVALLQGAINAAQLPNGYKPARVMAAMPLAGFPALPLIFLNEDLNQQENIPIGVDNETVGDLIQPGRVNIWTQTEQDSYMLRLTVISLNSDERYFYRDFIKAVMRMSMAYAFSQFGADLEHSFQANAYQEVDQTNNVMPGWYACDVLFSFTATANIAVTTSYDLIETILGTYSDYEGNVVVETENPTL
jgi:hypothetical protein